VVYRELEKKSLRNEMRKSRCSDLKRGEKDTL